MKIEAGISTLLQRVVGSAARGASAPTEGGRGGDILWRPPVNSLLGLLSHKRERVHYLSNYLQDTGLSGDIVQKNIPHASVYGFLSCRLPLYENPARRRPDPRNGLPESELSR